MCIMYMYMYLQTFRTIISDFKVTNLQYLFPKIIFNYRYWYLYRYVIGTYGHNNWLQNRDFSILYLFIDTILRLNAFLLFR